MFTFLDVLKTSNPTEKVQLAGYRGEGLLVIEVKGYWL